MEKVEGGVILCSLELDYLLDLKDEGRSVVGLAIKAIGKKPDKEHSAEIMIYAIFEKDMKFYYRKDDFYQPGKGKAYGTQPVRLVKDVKFKNRTHMDTLYGDDKASFCFSFIREKKVRDLTVKYPHLFLASVLEELQGENFTFQMHGQGVSDSDGESSIPCPPVWSGIPTQNDGLVKLKKAQLALLNDWIELKDQLEALLATDLCSKPELSYREYL